MEEILEKTDKRLLAAGVAGALALPLVVGVLLFYVQIYS